MQEEPRSNTSGMPSRLSRVCVSPDVCGWASAMQKLPAPLNRPIPTSTYHGAERAEAILEREDDCFWRLFPPDPPFPWLLFVGLLGSSPTSCSNSMSSSLCTTSSSSQKQRHLRRGSPEKCFVARESARERGTKFMLRSASEKET